MPADDLLYILVWWLMLLVLTLVNYPLTARLFSRFVDRGYIFAKILGILLLSYVVYVLGTLHIAPFTFITILSVLLIFTLINIVIILKFSARAENFKNLNKENKENKKSRSLAVKLAIVEEFLFVLILYLWSYVRAHQPAIEGLEKLMDYGFIKSILASNYFPPQDMWLSPAPLSTEFKPEITSMLKGFYINYYYFGHLVAAVLTKLSQLPAAVTYNLQLATIAAFTFAGSFSLGVNLISTNRREASEGTPKNRSRRTTPRKGTEEVSLSLRKLLFVGLLTAYLVTFSGNLHTIYSFTPGYSPKDNELPPPPWQLSFDTHLTDYWYPNATRFIPFTIHEFPAYSFIVSDLHGHVSNIPFVLLILAVLLNLIRSTNSQIPNSKFQTNSKFQIPNSKMSRPWYKWFGHWVIENCKLIENCNLKIVNLLLIGFLLAVFYMTNSWDTLVYGLLSAAILLAREIKLGFESKKSLALNFTSKLAVIGLTFLVFSLPFNHFFHPFSSKIGVNCGYEMLKTVELAAKKLSFKSEKSLAFKEAASNESPQSIAAGPFLFEPSDCQKTPLWMHLILWGFFYYIIAGFITFILWPKLKSRITNYELPQYHSVRGRRITNTDKFLALLIVLSVFLLWLPEFIYIKDIYPAHFRANTMFKLGYQAFIMLSLVAGYTITQIVLKARPFIKGKPFYKNLITKNFPHVRGIFRKIYILLLIPQLFLVSIYPLFGINSYYGSLTNYRGLYGLNWLWDRYPDDYNAIVWLDEQDLCHGLSGCPIILEAVGDSYTVYARVSANTGLPTVIGWPVHEWLWRGSYDEAGKRKGEVETIYTSQDFHQVQPLLNKYNVDYVFVGDLEREKYPNLNEKIFKNLGTIVYQSGNTRIYRL